MTLDEIKQAAQIKYDNTSKDGGIEWHAASITINILATSDTLVDAETHFTHHLQDIIFDNTLPHRINEAVIQAAKWYLDTATEWLQTRKQFKNLIGEAETAIAETNA